MQSAKFERLDVKIHMPEDVKNAIQLLYSRLWKIRSNMHSQIGTCAEYPHEKAEVAAYSDSGQWTRMDPTW
ncbi:MAG: hypothetical protein ACLTMH_14725 [Faecalimonas umbilicata]|uniref:hypothetical protein n=1 Tax=Faecalimonas umbilicata TaxID=1912855 RepID=UPI0039942984